MQDQAGDRKSAARLYVTRDTRHKGNLPRVRDGSVSYGRHRCPCQSSQTGDRRSAERKGESHQSQVRQSQVENEGENNVKSEVSINNENSDSGDGKIACGCEEKSDRRKRR